MFSAKRSLSSAVIAIALVSCGGDNGPTDPDGGDSDFVATVDGTAWASDPGSVAIGAINGAPGMYVFTGSQFGQLTISITLYNVRGAGTYALGVGPSAMGGTVVMSNQTGGWATPLSGTAGSITLTTLTDDRITGTFQFIADAISGAATGTKTVTGGAFDLKVTRNGTVGPVPDQAGSIVTAELNGVDFNAASIASVLNTGSQGGFSLAGTTTERSISITFTGVTEAGVYQTGTGRHIRVSNVVAPLANMWTTQEAGGSGTVTIESITATRITGTFSGTLVPAAATSTAGTITIENGEFDLGRAVAP